MLVSCESLSLEFLGTAGQGRRREDGEAKKRRSSHSLPALFLSFLQTPRSRRTSSLVLVGTAGLRIGSGCVESSGCVV